MRQHVIPRPGVEGPEELVGLDAQHFYVDAGDRERWKQQLEVSSADSESELRLVRADGEIIWVRDTGRALVDEEGNLALRGALLIDRPLLGVTECAGDIAKAFLRRPFSEGRSELEIIG